MIVRQAVKNDRWDGEGLVAEAVDVRMESQQAMLAVDGAKDTFAAFLTGTRNLRSSSMKSKNHFVTN